MIRATTFAAFLLLSGAAVFSEAPEPELRLYHHDSGPADAGYHEVFRVTGVQGHIGKDALDVTVDGAPVNATWSGETWVQVGDELRFHLISFDAPRTIDIHGDGLHARLVFGGGAGTPVPP